MQPIKSPVTVFGCFAYMPHPDLARWHILSLRLVCSLTGGTLEDWAKENMTD